MMVKCIKKGTFRFSRLKFSLESNGKSGVARWHNFRRETPTWVCFGGPWRIKCWYILLPFGIFEGHWACLCPFGKFAVIWYIFTRSGQLFQDQSGNPLGRGASVSWIGDSWKLTLSSTLNTYICMYILSFVFTYVYYLCVIPLLQNT
jgi:hypothetical protein